MAVILNSRLVGKLAHQLITAGLWAAAHVGKFIQIFINLNGKIGTDKIKGTKVNSYLLLGNMRNYDLLPSVDFSRVSYIYKFFLY